MLIAALAMARVGWLVAGVTVALTVFVAWAADSRRWAHSRLSRLAHHARPPRQPVYVDLPATRQLPRDAISADDAYARWAQATGDAQRELDTWRAAAQADQPAAHARYAAALDREEAAAGELALALGERGSRPAPRTRRQRLPSTFTDPSHPQRSPHD